MSLGLHSLLYVAKVSIPSQATKNMEQLYTIRQPRESNATLQPKGFLLLDSGAQYLDGTTDITRTIALGELTTEEEKQIIHWF